MTRRTLARLLASAAALPAIAQTPAGDIEKIVAGQMKDNADDLDKVKLPLATEPAFRFKA